MSQDHHQAPLSLRSACTETAPEVVRTLQTYPRSTPKQHASPTTTAGPNVTDPNLADHVLSQVVALLTSTRKSRSL